VPLIKLDKNPLYHKYIEKVMHGMGPKNKTDPLNVQDECPTIVFGPRIDDKEDCVAHFYVNLNIMIKCCTTTCWTMELHTTS